MAKKYKEYKQVNYPEIASDILSFWDKNKIFEKSVTERKDAEAYTFFEGPPSANGVPGIHHVMSRAVKDIFCRYKTLKGFRVERKGGWDTHGLPVELQVEKELGITKEDIGKKISVEEYNRRCRETVMKYKDTWDNLTQKMGYWLDLDNPYITFEAEYMESLWSLLRKLYDKGLLYKGYTIQPYSPAAGTGLSSHELNQPGCYRMVKDTTVTGQFKVKGTEDEFFLAWTTTPWTLAGNTALVVGPSIEYVKVDTFNPYTHQRVKVILAKDRVPAYFSEKAADIPLEDYKPGDKLIPYKIIDTHLGTDLIGWEYEQLMPYIQPETPAFRVIEGDYVTTEDGTGIVHIAPTFGADDYRVAQKAGIPALLVKDAEGAPAPIVDKQGKYVQEIADFAGMYIKNEYYPEGEAPEKSLDVQIAIKLKEENKAFKVEKYEHSYPHCWRTDKPILYYPLDSWFIKTTAYKDKLVELNKTINWKPASTGQGRFGNWLENLVDWNLSRSRYWGTPLPIWRTEDGKEEKCIGSIKELEEEIRKSVDKGIMEESPYKGKEVDLHRPYVDDVVLVSESGRKMFREKDLIDVWFDSGAMPYAQWHYPFENEQKFKDNYPADFIAEGVDQTRGWFFTLHAIAGMLFDNVAYKNVIANGLVLDKEGNKMSKRLGNAIDPFQTLDTYGPDATRWYMIANANPWDNLKFDLDGVIEVQRRFFGTLHNTYNFFALYANIDGFTYAEEDVAYNKRPESDRWILSKLNSLIRKAENAYDDYEPTRAARAIQEFTIDDLSNWYVRLNRKRFWKPSGKSGLDENKLAAYQTLYTCLMTIAKLASPVAPFYMENMYQDLNKIAGRDKDESVHLTNFPHADESIIDKDLEERMSIAQTTSSLVHSLRKKHNIKVRQPLSRILMPEVNAHFKEQVKAVEDIILMEVNVKEIEFVSDSSDVLVKKIKPNFRKLGQQYGPKMKEISAAINILSPEQIAMLESEDRLELSIRDGSIELTSEDIEVSYADIPGWSVAREGKVTVALDIKVTDELQKEGLARDVINRIQNLRKDSGFDVQDKIHIQIERNGDFVNQALEEHKDYICGETQALSLVLEENIQNGKDLEIDEHNLVVKINKA
ncbi:MAG: isoleucine--tRNA ligase [Candidatus Cyclobacteriaceae bacterium M2_1C_046]